MIERLVVCAWCGESAIDEKLVQMSKITKKNGVPVIIAPERKVPACALHMAIPAVDEPTVRRAKYAAGCKGRKKLQERLF